MPLTSSPCKFLLCPWLVSPRYVGTLKSRTLLDPNYEPSATTVALAPLSPDLRYPVSSVVLPVPRHHLLGGLLAWSVLQVPGLLEPSGVRSGEDRGLSHVLHEPPLPAERRDQQHRSAGAEAGGNSAPSACHSQVSYSLPSGTLAPTRVLLLTAIPSLPPSDWLLAYLFLSSALLDIGCCLFSSPVTLTFFLCLLSGADEWLSFEKTGVRFLRFCLMKVKMPQ